jgi:hypothetical protein
MTKTLTYKLELGVSDSADVEDIEDFLQQILLDLYEQGQVEQIRVTKDGHTTDMEDVEEMVDMLDGVDSDAIRKAIDSVRELENMDDGQN